MKKLNLVPSPFPLESGRGMKSHNWEIYDWKKKFEIDLTKTQFSKDSR